MVLVAKNTAVLTDPFYVAVFTIEKIGGFSFLPFMGETESVYFNRNSFYLYLFSTQNTNFILQTSNLSIND